ncbi:sulfatase family protein [Sorangium sp. So ce1182]|uniref:sulfatase family protein n=1 Tax=Sorangium sp. So ce1182 TaxID=3133334 RepID=UPI003F6222F4
MKRRRVELGSAVAVLLIAVFGFFTIPPRYEGVEDAALFDRIVAVVSTDLVPFVRVVVALVIGLAAGTAILGGVVLRAFRVERRGAQAALIAGGWYAFLFASCVRAPAMFADTLMALPLFSPRLVLLVARTPVLGHAICWAGLYGVPLAVAAGLVVAVTRRRRVLPAALLAAVLLAILAPQVRDFRDLYRVRHRRASAKKSVLVVAVDSLRADQVGLRRDGVLVAPHLERLAGASLFFPETIVALPRTAPSLTSFFTSQYPMKHGVSSMWSPAAMWNQQRHALPVVMANNGYDTFALSDYVGEFLSKIDLGFERVTVPTVELTEIAEQAVLSRQPLLLALALHPLFRPLVPRSIDHVILGYTEYSDPGVILPRLAREVARADEAGRPFFGFLFISPPHSPYASLFPHYARFAAPDYDGPYLFKKDYTSVPRGEPDRAQVRALYAGAVGMADDLVGEVAELLAPSGVGLVVTADHGELLYDHPDVGMGHGDVLRYPHAYTVPLAFFDPAGTWPRGRVDGPVRSIDFAPTLVDLLERYSGEAFSIAPPEQWNRRAFWDGTSLVGSARDPGGFDDIAYAETGLWMTPDAAGARPRIPYPDITALLEPLADPSHRLVMKRDFVPLFLAAKHRMIRRGPLKLLYEPTPDGPVYELYDVVQDPLEQHDLSRLEPARVAELAGILGQLMLGYRDGSVVP